MSSIPNNISVSLSTKTDSHWKRCFDLTHEMIITAPGRRVFPTLEYDIRGLDPRKYYSVCMHFELVDSMKLSFVMGNWTQSLSNEGKGAPRRVVHHHGLQLGQNWMDRPLSFDQIRITNRKSNEQTKGPSFVHLFTQHRYIPVLTIYEGDHIAHVSKIDYTGFIPVTSYHSNGVVDLKKTINPYAFGCIGRRNEKSPRSPDDSDALNSPVPLKKVKKEEEGEDDVISAPLSLSNSFIQSESLSSSPKPLEPVTHSNFLNVDTETTIVPILPNIPILPCFPNIPLMQNVLQTQNFLQNQLDFQQKLLVLQMSFAFPPMYLNQFLNPLSNSLFPTPSPNPEDQFAASAKTESSDSENI
ncbi:hypothetical protein CRE_08574 [Caenorhabditis remanei]|uniref:T-box domain-containing protein n=1 Tax=Caenorhabditis remanei TaxID=31234 RepID=E3NH10_CAERE|nr:hypothetical protein CRE_08574 [Caenorhabditis remanei]